MLTPELIKLKEYLKSGNSLEIEGLDKGKLLKELLEIDKVELVDTVEDLFEGIVEEDKIGRGIKDVRYISVKSISLSKDRCPCCGRKY